MNKKKLVLAGLTGTIAASVFVTVFSVGNPNSFKAPSTAGAESGSRSITITDIAGKGYYEKTTRGVDGYDDTIVTYALSNPGSYGYVELYTGDPNELVNIDDGFVNFTNDNGALYLMRFDFEHVSDFYETEADSYDENKKLPIYNFAYHSVSSVIIEMGSRNSGEIKYEGLEYGLVGDYDPNTDTYTISNIENANVSGLYVYATSRYAYFHIKSITINYNC